MRAVITAIAAGCGIAASWNSLGAQCPDGTPPPCTLAVTHPAAPNTVAVLYFDNLSRDTADAYLADGLTEEIIIRLGQVQRLAVKSRFEVQRFRGRATLDPQVIGRALNAAYLVTGSVQRDADQVRLRVTLIRAASRAQVWGDVIDRASGRLLTIESDIAREVATAITGQLLPEERTRLARPLTSDPTAYEEYLRGLRALNSTFAETALRGAIVHFDRAIARDSGFAAAFAGEAVAWMSLADGYVWPREGYSRARAAARRALSLDSSQALPYTTLALAALALDLDAREAERLARRAVRLDPRNSWTRGGLSVVLRAEGRFGESIDEARRAWESDSLFAFSGTEYMLTLIYGRRLDSATALLPRVRAVLSPVDGDRVEGLLLVARGDWRSAAPLLDWRWYGGAVAGAYVRALLARGDTLGARATVDSMLAARASGYYNAVALARAYTVLGDLDRGFEWLQRAFEERTGFVALYVPWDDDLAPLRADPRYAALARQLRY